MSRSAQEALDFIESGDSSVQEMIETKDSLLNLAALIHLQNGHCQKALSFAEKALEISPKEPEFLVTKAKALITRAQSDDNIVSSYLDIVPHFNDHEDIQKALNLLKEAEKFAQQQNKGYLIPEILFGIATAFVWLRRGEEATQVLELLNSESLPLELQSRVDVMNFAERLCNRDFELAHNMLKKSRNYSRIDYFEKTRLALILLDRGAPEQAKLLFDDLEAEAEANKDPSYWLNISSVNILLENKEAAIQAVTKAKQYSEEGDIDRDQKKMLLSHINTVMLRYSKRGRDAKDSETDRFVEAIDEYQREFPEDRAVLQLQALDEEGKLTQEIKDLLLKQKEWYENAKKEFRAQKFTTYDIARSLNRRYSDFIAYREDPDFTIEFSVPDREFTDELNNNFLRAKGFVFDYLSLLDLSKTNLLGFLEKLDRPMSIHKDLFAKIQQELLLNEIEELRRLWNFLRKSKSISFIHCDLGTSIDVQRSDQLPDDWLIKSIEFAKAKEQVFVTDDLRLLGLARADNIKSINITVFLKSWLDNGYIDKKVYSRALGDLAERFYTFIPFSGQDLFEIVTEDDGRITLRSYHLVSQVFLPDSKIETFTKVFIEFISRLWSVGLLPREKVDWVKFLTNVIHRLIEGLDLIKDRERIEGITADLTSIWFEAIKNGTRNDLLELQKTFDESLDKDYTSRIRGMLKRKIAERLYM